MANGIIVLVTSQTDFYFHNFTKRIFLNLAHFFPCDLKLRLLAHSRSLLASQNARNVIVGAENLLNIQYSEFYVIWKILRQV